jgi:NADPH:quinone reductase-like Zn-dependent oxidoreductase
MRAAVVERYGGPEVVRVRDVDDPTIASHDVLVRVAATTVGSTDGTNRSGRPAFSRLFFGLARPRHRVLGYDFAGVVERVGPAVRRFAPGDRVYGTLAPAPGAHAELVRIAEHGVVAPIPDGLDAVGAVSLLDGFFTAMPFLRDGARVRAGQNVLVNGASGTVGSSAVQFAKHLGATVVGVCGSEHVELVRSLGADRVIDYTREDFAANINAYDVIFDAVGKRSFRGCRRALTPDGIYLSTVPTLPVLLRARHARSSETGRRAGILFTGLSSVAAKSADLVLIGELAESGAIVPVIDRVVPFEAIAEAHQRVDGGHKAGNVVVAMTSSPLDVSEQTSAHVASEGRNTPGAVS